MESPMVSGLVHTVDRLAEDPSNAAGQSTRTTEAGTTDVRSNDEFAPPVTKGDKPVPPGNNHVNNNDGTRDKGKGRVGTLHPPR